MILESTKTMSNASTKPPTPIEIAVVSDTALVSEVNAIRWPKMNKPIIDAIGPMAASGTMYFPQISPGLVNSASISFHVARGSSRMPFTRLVSVSIAIEFSPLGTPPR